MKIVLITSCYNNLTRKILSSKDLDIVGIGIAKSNSPLHFKDKIKEYLCDFFFRYFKSNPKLIKPLPLIEFNKDEQKDLCEWLVKVNPDLVIINSSPFLFDIEVIRVPRLEIVNTHQAIFKFRGQLEGYYKNPSVVTHFRPGQIIDFGTGYYLACLDGIITIKKQKASVVKTMMTHLWL